MGRARLEKDAVFDLPDIHVGNAGQGLQGDGAAHRIHGGQPAFATADFDVDIELADRNRRIAQQGGEQVRHRRQRDQVELELDADRCAVEGGTRRAAHIHGRFHHLRVQLRAVQDAEHPKRPAGNADRRWRAQDVVAVIQLDQAGEDVERIDGRCRQRRRVRIHAHQVAKAHGRAGAAQLGRQRAEGAGQAGLRLCLGLPAQRGGNLAQRDIGIQRLRRARDIGLQLQLGEKAEQVDVTLRQRVPVERGQVQVGPEQAAEQGIEQGAFGRVDTGQARARGHAGASHGAGCARV